MTDVLLDEEDREFLASFKPLPQSFKGFGRPKKISADDYHRDEDQGPMGSCRGNSGTSTLERLANVSSKRIVQLSRIFFYLATQKIDGLLGSDRGSTISGGFKLMLETGCPLEELTGYPRGYPDSGERLRVLAPANYAAGAEFKALSVVAAPADYDAVCDAIAGGGALDYGISWYQGIIPADRVVRRFSPPPRAGGHANCVLGYDDDKGLLEARNSHRDGKYWITPEAWRQMVAHGYTAAGIVFGQTEPTPINWSQERYL
jgi:hypothetical protein